MTTPLRLRLHSAHTLIVGRTMDIATVITGLAFLAVLLDMHRRLGATQRDNQRLSTQLSELTEALHRQERRHENQIQEIRDRNDEEVKRQKKDIDALRAHSDRSKKLMDLYSDMYEDEVRSRERRESDEYIPGADAGD